VQGQVAITPVLHSEILPEHDCGGELIELPEDELNVHFAQCAGCGTEFTFVPDSDWVTVVCPGMRTDG
jgi:hypothetical protein